MVNLKNIIFRICFKYKILKCIYCFFSYVKGKIIYGAKLAIPIIIYKKKSNKRVFLVFTPEHANLGDHAIAFAEKQMLDKLHIEFFEITGKQLYILNQYNYLKLLDKSNILINGGGNLGTLWPDIEKMNRNIIINCSKSHIYILPNSIYYDNAEEFEKSKVVYNSHSNLYLYAREEISYKLMKENYMNVKLIPDMVLSLDFSNNQLYMRKGCLLCMRSDIERTIDDQQKDKLLNIIYDKFEKVWNGNTVLDHYVSVKEREKMLIDKLNEFKSAELVITDRLHGMIFSAITGTNCIVINSKSPKIVGCYKWLKKLDYICFLDNENNFEAKLDKLLENKSNIFNNKEIIELFKILENDLKHLSS